MSVAEFQTLSLPDGKAELVRGKLVVTPPPGGPHGVAASNLVFLLTMQVTAHRLGRVFQDGVGYELIDLPRTVRAPDGSFVRARRLPAEGIGPGLLTVSPDLVIEVLSPGESVRDLDEKLDDFMAAGTRLAWVVDPARRTVAIVSKAARVQLLRETDTLSGAAVVPGFSCAVTEIFEGIARWP